MLDARRSAYDKGQADLVAREQAHAVKVAALDKATATSAGARDAAEAALAKRAARKLTTAQAAVDEMRSQPSRPNWPRSKS